jgi:hypothetical protein
MIYIHVAHEYKISTQLFGSADAWMKRKVCRKVSAKLHEKTPRIV